MSSVYAPNPTTEAVGRLPAPPAGLPINLNDFKHLASVWRSCGLWLSVWNAEGACLSVDEEAPKFWHQLWTAGAGFQRALAQHVRNVIRPNGTLASEASLGPWAPQLLVYVAPLQDESRPAGYLVGAFLRSAALDEPLLRLCSECKLDQQLMERLAADAFTRGTASFEALRSLFMLTALQARRLEKAQDEVNALTHHLQETYEELNLIYQISGRMSLAHQPARVLAMVGDELLETCRAAGIAFVLRDAESGSRHEYGAPFALPGSDDRTIQLGEGAPTSDDLERLVDCIADDLNGSAPHLLLNNAARNPELAWAAPWLKHLVALPLWREHELLGVMFAINCIDEGDFTSVDVQLFRAVADRVAPFLENHRLYEDLADLLMGLLHAMVNSIDAKDTYTCGHSERVALYSRSLAKAAHLPPATCERIYLAGLLHDVGKIGVPDAILCKTGKLSLDEFAIMKKHPEIGARILARVRQIKDLLPGVMHHHERMDGRGYPAGLTGPDIPLFGRIICIADCFDAMTTNRTYRAAMPLPAALAELRRCAGTQFDPQLTEIFLELDHEQLIADGRTLSSSADPSSWAKDVHTGA